MNLLITGASGFIGNYFIETYSEKLNISTFSFLKDNFHTLDLKNTTTILHLSALVHQMGGASEDEYERVNVTQTIELAKKAKESGVRHFIFMSSVKVYGEESETPYNEETTCEPKDAYGMSKLKAEQELQKLEDDNCVMSIIRTPIVYGYGVKANIKNLITLVDKFSILPFGAIDNKRNIVYIGNLCHMIDEIIKQKKSGLFLASDDKPLSTTQLIKNIAYSLDKKIYLLKIPFFETLLKVLKPSYHKRLYGSLELNNSVTKEMLNLKNKYTTLEGINFMINNEKV